jgi:hypothetical protein
VTKDELGVPLSVGRKRRTIAGSIKRVLLKRDTAWTFPGCTHQIFLEGHHIQHWADGGEMSLMNAALLYSLHHRYVHEYGYSTELGVDLRPHFAILAVGSWQWRTRPALIGGVRRDQGCARCVRR